MEEILNIEKFLDDEDEEFESGNINSRYDIDFEITSLSVRDIDAMLDKGKLFLPSFQRSFIWNNSKSSLFIDSILLGLPVPNITLYNKEGKLYIIDGGHRIRALTRFRKDTISINSSDSCWHRKKYSTLSEDDQYNFDSYKMSTIIFKEADPSKGYSVYEVFNRINSKSEPLSQQEIRNAVYDCQFLKSLKENISSFRFDMYSVQKFDAQDLYDKLYKRKDKETEIVLRYLAYSHINSIENQTKPSKSKVIADYLEDNKNNSDSVAIDEFGKFTKNFRKFSELSDPFYWHGSNKIGDFLIESLLVASEKFDSLPMWITQENFDEFKKYFKNLDCCTKATTNFSAFETRVKIISKYFSSNNNIPLEELEETE